MNSVFTYFKAQQWAFSYVKNKDVTNEEIDRILCGLKGWNTTDLLINYQTEMPENEFEEFKALLDRFIQGEPIAYLLGFQSFYGLNLNVSSDTLIPRPETEELVDWILEDNDINQGLSVLDIGTGTGAIGLALKQNSANWNVMLSDISDKALRVAKQNAKNLGLKVETVQSDLTQNIDDKFDIIVSNPPYIAEDERKYMDESAINFEPHLALFAENNGLALYERIATEISKNLKNNTVIYLEIGFKQGNAVKKIFQKEFPKAKITVKKDFYDNDRMVRIKYRGEKDANDENIY